MEIFAFVNLKDEGVLKLSHPLLMGQSCLPRGGLCDKKKREEWLTVLIPKLSLLQQMKGEICSCWAEQWVPSTDSTDTTGWGERYLMNAPRKRNSPAGRKLVFQGEEFPTWRNLACNEEIGLIISSPPPLKLGICVYMFVKDHVNISTLVLTLKCRYSSIYACYWAHNYDRNTYVAFAQQDDLSLNLD